MSKITAKNAVLFGISNDTVESHKKFYDQYHLGFPLLADVDKKVTEAYGVMSPRGFPNRVTFVIGPDGKIRSIDRAVNEQFNRAPDGLTSRHGENLVLGLSDWHAKVGEVVPSFSVGDVFGKTAAAPAPGKKATVVIFASMTCPVCRAYRGRFLALVNDPVNKDVAFLLLFPNEGEAAASIQAIVPQEGNVRAALDTEGLSKHFAATVTPTAWVIDAKGKAVYSGAIDDNREGGQVKASYLKDALDAVLAGKPIPMPETKSTGTPLRLPSR